MGAVLIDLGDPLPDLGVTVRNDSTGALADADSVTLTITKPDGTTTSPSVTHVSTGVYTAAYTPSVQGQFLAAWTITDTDPDIASAMEVEYNVQPAGIEGIISLADFQAMTKNTVSADDDTQRKMILAASSLCEKHTQVWRRQTVVRSFDVGCAVGALKLRRPVISVTTVVENGSTLTSGTDYVLNGEDGLLYRGSSLFPRCWLEGRQVTTVTYVAGVTTAVPADLAEGVAHLAKYLLAEYRGGSGLPRAGAESFASFRDLPNRVQMLWAPYTPVLVA